MKKLQKWSGVVSCGAIMSLSLIACGGGGGGNGSSGNPEVQQPNAVESSGIFLDSPVQGIRYETPSFTGITDANGRFRFNQGEQITFTIFGNSFGPIDASTIVTPFDFIAGADHLDLAINLVRILMTLDTDGDLSTINLPSDVSATLNFDQPSDDFEQDSAVQNFVSSNANTTLVSEEAAQEHVNESLATQDADIDLSNTVVYAELINDRCPEADERAITTYTFSSSQVTISGGYAYDESCNVLKYEAGFTEPTPGEIVPFPNPVPIADFMADNPANIFHCSDAICSLEELNQVTKADGDARASAHSAGSKHFRHAVTKADETQVFHVAFQGYEINFRGKTASSVITSSYCQNDVSVGYDYTFGATEFSRVGSDGLEHRDGRQCVKGRTETVTEAYDEHEYTLDSTFPCEAFPVCTYEDLNRATEGVDRDDREFKTTRQHLPGSKVMRIDKAVGNTFTTILTID